jgi:hypothetical protein
MQQDAPHKDKVVHNFSWAKLKDVTMTIYNNVTAWIKIPHVVYNINWTKLKMLCITPIQELHSMHHNSHAIVLFLLLQQVMTDYERLSWVDTRKHEDIEYFLFTVC